MGILRVVSFEGGHMFLAQEDGPKLPYYSGKEFHFIRWQGHVRDILRSRSITVNTTNTEQTINHTNYYKHKTFKWETRQKYEM